MRLVIVRMLLEMRLVIIIVGFVSEFQAQVRNMLGIAAPTKAENLSRIADLRCWHFVLPVRLDICIAAVVVVG